jgi:hypothetical protein
MGLLKRAILISTPLAFGTFIANIISYVTGTMPLISFRGYILLWSMLTACSYISMAFLLKSLKIKPSELDRYIKTWRDL